MLGCWDFSGEAQIHRTQFVRRVGDGRIPLKPTAARHETSRDHLVLWNLEIIAIICNNSQYGAFWPPRGSEFVLQISWSGPLGGFWCHALGKKKGCAVCAERNFNELLPWSSMIFNVLLPCFPVVAQQTWFILVLKSLGFKFPWCVDVSNTGCFAPWTSCGEWNWYEPQFLCVTCKLCPGTVCYSSDVFDRATWICCFDGVIVCDCEITGFRILTLDILGYLPSWTVLGGRVEVHPLSPMS